MNRRDLLAILSLGPFAGAVPAASQQRGKVYRIGHLSASGAAASKAFVAAFRDGMRTLGYAEGQNWVLDERYAEGKEERLAPLVRELIERKPDVLVVATTPANVVAKAATSTIPIVMVLVADPVGTGIVANLAHPGGNITGVTNIVAELGGKRLELLKEILPAASRIAVIVNPDNPNAAPQLRYAETAARGLGIELQPVVPVRVPADLERGFQDAVRAGAHGAIRMIDALVFILRKETAALSIKYRLPLVYPARDDVEAGGLVSYGTNIAEQFRQAALFVHKILRGARPADLPVEQPTKYEMVINLKTANALGLTIPPALLVRAD